VDARDESSIGVLRGYDMRHPVAVSGDYLRHSLFVCLIFDE